MTAPSTPVGNISSENFAAARRRAAEIVSKMTLKDKIGQLGINPLPAPSVGLNAYPMMNHEALHGLTHPGATSFPVPLALAQTWNPELISDIYTAVSDEARRGSYKIRWCFGASFTGNAESGSGLALGPGSGSAGRRSIARFTVGCENHPRHAGCGHKISENHFVRQTFCLQWNRKRPAYGFSRSRCAASANITCRHFSRPLGKPVAFQYWRPTTP